jgi:hypothetical protein
MSWIRIHNRANVAVNVQLSNAGFVYHYENNVKTYTEFFVAAIGWDFKAVRASDDTKIDPSSGNISLGFNVGLLVIGTLVTVAGIVLTVATMGGGTPIAVGGVELTGAALTAIRVAAGVTAGATAFTTVGSIVMALGPGVLAPATITGLYGGNDYEIYIDGTFTQGLDTTTNPNQVTETATKPLVASWMNDQTGSRSVASGYSIP